jgi:hypothetical protein
MHRNICADLKNSVRNFGKFIIDFTIVKIVRYIKNKTYVIIQPGDVFKIIWHRAAITSADYIESKLDKALLFSVREKLWDFAFTRIDFELGSFAEFGVLSAISINYFAKKLENKNKNIFGFDSFEGLKEDWYGTESGIGTFDLKGQLPKVLPNVNLIKGYFDKTVPIFLTENIDKFAFIHLDADTYESTLLVLNLIKDRILKDTIIIFDEYLGFPNWQNGEYSAWQRFVSENDIKYRYLGFSTQQAAIQII